MIECASKRIVTVDVQAIGPFDFQHEPMHATLWPDGRFEKRGDRFG